MGVLSRDKKKIRDSRAGTQGRHKRFSQEKYQKHDGPAVDAVLSHLDSVGIWAKRNDDLYGPDIVVYNGFKPQYYIEVEQRKGWDSGPFPSQWNPLHIPSRKGKYLKLGLPIEFWVMSMGLKNCIVVPDFIIMKHGELKEFSNSQIASGEKFYHIDLTHCILKEI